MSHKYFLLSEIPLHNTNFNLDNTFLSDKHNPRFVDLQIGWVHYYTMGSFEQFCFVIEIKLVKSYFLWTNIEHLLENVLKWTPH